MVSIHRTTVIMKAFTTFNLQWLAKILLKLCYISAKIFFLSYLRSLGVIEIEPVYPAYRQLFFLLRIKKKSSQEPPLLLEGLKTKGNKICFSSNTFTENNIKLEIANFIALHLFYIKLLQISFGGPNGSICRTSKEPDSIYLIYL